MQQMLPKNRQTALLEDSPDEDDNIDPRILKTRRIVRAATVDLLAEYGFQRITVEHISELSGVARSTIYRHWPNPKDLLVETFEHIYVPTDQPTTGDLRTDLIEHCEGLASALNDDKRGRIIGSLINASLHDEELASIHARYTQSRRRRTRSILQKAVAKGDLPKKLDYDHIITSLVAPIFYERFIAEQIIEASFIKRVVDGVLLQISAGAEQKKTRARKSASS